MINKQIATVFFLLFFGFNLIAQNDSLTTRKAQVTFICPLGTNGVNSMEYSNKFSLNILFGMNGGLNGVEIGGVANYNNSDVHGTQLAGVINVNNGLSKGAIISGVSNICLGETSGIVLSGAGNFISGNSKGMQLSTVNICAGKTTGMQLGVVNSTKSFKGMQLGVVNSTKSFGGMQLGVVNIADSTSGIPIGIVSVVKKGYYAFEVSSSEVLCGSFSYKMGVERFYNIFKVGISNYKNKPVYAFGYGFGSLIPLGGRHKIALEATGNQIVYENKWEGINSLNIFNTNYQFRLTKKLSVGAGPSMNVYITDQKVGGEYGTIRIPKTIYEHEYHSNKLFMWIGFNAGISLKL